MKVLAGVDGGVPQADALRLAAQLAAVGGGSVIAVTTRPDAGSILDLADDQLRGVPHELRPVVGVPVHEALHELAEEIGADVLVIGSTHRGKIGRTLLGSTGESVLHGAPCPVAVAPRRYGHAQADVDPAHAFRRVAVAYDGLRESRAALAWAREVVERSGGSLTLLSVAEAGIELDPTLPALTTDEVLVPAARSRREELEAAVKALPDEIHAEGRVLEGPVAATLAEASADYDLLVAGSRGHGPIGQVLLGGVSRKLLHESRAPLVVVPRSAIEHAHDEHRSEEEPLERPPPQNADTHPSARVAERVPPRFA